MNGSGLPGNNLDAPYVCFHRVFVYYSTILKFHRWLDLCVPVPANLLLIEGDFLVCKYVLSK